MRFVGNIIVFVKCVTRLSYMDVHKRNQKIFMTMSSFKLGLSRMSGFRTNGRGV